MTIYCTYCGQGFARNEHLQRHVLTHSDLRPYDCPICHLTFKRKDLMKKHFLTHHANDSPTSAEARALLAKVRSTAACANCARTKTKCDNDTKQPCTRCRAKGLTCAARVTRPRGPRPKQKPPNQRAESPADASQSYGGVDKELQTPSASSCSAASGDEGGGEPGPSITVAASSSSWENNIALDDLNPAGELMLSPSQQQPQSMIMAQQNMNPDLFSSSMGTASGGPAVFNPTWDFGTSPDPFEQFFNPGSDVFGPFLPFASPPNFSNGMEQQASATPAMDVVVAPEPAQQEVQVPIDTGTQNHDDHDVLVNDVWSKDVEHWTMFQCCPRPLTVCPGRATTYLSFLEVSSSSRRSPGPWSMQTINSNTNNTRRNVSLSAVTRERIAAITQSFFPKALEMHGLGTTTATSPPSSSTISPASHRRPSDWFGSSGFIVLPPTEDLDVFLSDYIHHVEPYYPLVPTRTLDPNELLVASGNEKGATLLLLLMISLGATTNPAPKARRLGAGLAEMCRIALTDLVEKDNQFSTVPLILQCSLLLTVQSCWGGEKWQMDIGAGHRFMYIAMLRNSGYFQSTTKRSQNKGAAVDGSISAHSAWRKWVEQEGRRRLAYDWVMLDQELSLFYDQPPTFAITELLAPLPDLDVLWLARSGTEWKSLYDATAAGVGPQSRPPQYSLRRLFQLCLANDIDSTSYTLTPTRLRLLLYPIQSLVFHHSQLLDLSFPYQHTLALSSFKPTTTTRTSTLLRLEELQGLLQTWWTLASSSSQEETDNDEEQTIANFVLFHLISLNLHTNLKAIEAFARGHQQDLNAESTEEDAEGDRQEFLSSRCIFAPHEALYHAGQILRLLTTTTTRHRPLWWAAAVYRVALVLWAYAMMSMSPPPPSITTSEMIVRIDAVEPGDCGMARFLRYQRGVTAVLGEEGVRVDGGNPGAVLSWCLGVLKQDKEGGTWFALGVGRKLEMLLQAWGGS